MKVLSLVFSVFVLVAAVVNLVFAYRHLRETRRVAQVSQRRLIIARHRSVCLKQVLDHEENLAAINLKYGMPRSHRQPGWKSPRERMEEIDMEIARMIDEGRLH